MDDDPNVGLAECSSSRDPKNTHCKWCSAINCTNSKNKRPDLTFFQFPKDPERCKQWVIASRRADLETKDPKTLAANNVMCEEHFEPCCFRATIKRKLLTKDAVPKLFKVPNPPPKQTSRRRSPTRRECALESQDTPSPPSPNHATTPSEISSSPAQMDQSSAQITSLKRKLQVERTKCSRFRKRCKLQFDTTATTTTTSASSSTNQTSDLEKLQTSLATYLPEKTCHFIMTQIRVSSIPKTGRRWTYNEKRFALSLFHASPKAYRLLQEMFTLPSPKTLSVAMQNIAIRPGLCGNMLQMFKIKVSNMSEMEKLCSVVIDEMALKTSLSYNSCYDEMEGLEDFGSLGRTSKHADHALVFILRGITHKWKQPIAYFLSNGPTKTIVLRSLILELIPQLFVLGLKPKVIIWDQGTNNRAVMTKLGVRCDKPYFVVDNKKLFVMFDPPHLVKSIRNNMKTHGFTIGTDTISWDYVAKFYEMDSSLPIRMAPKLTRKHIQMPAFTNLSVRLAVQVLSHTVAAGISTMIRLNALPQEASATAEFTEEFDRLFNAFNSRALKSKTPLANAISERSEHVAFLQDKLAWLKTIKPMNKTGQLPCLQGIILTIKGLLQLWDDLNKNHDLKFLMTSRLNQDCLENLFSVVRGKGGHRYNPDCREFKSAMKQTMVDAILIASDSKNCQTDVDAFLFSLENIVSQGAPSAIKSRIAQAVRTTPQQYNSLLQQNHMPAQTVTEDNILTYLAGYVAKKLLPLVCNSCKTILVAEKGSGKQHHIFLNEKQHYADCVPGGLTMPSDDLHKTIEKAEQVFRSNVRSLIVATGIRFKFVNKMMEATQGIICCPEEKCALTFMAVNLYTTVRLHFHIKCLNRMNKDNKTLSATRKKLGAFQHH